MQDSGFLNVPDARLYYEVAGAGPPLVFVHGFTFDTRMWDDQWSVCGEHYRVVRYDLRGFGRSAPEPVPYSDVDDLLALLNFLDIDRAHLVGLSMGGIVSVHFALGHSGRVRGLVAADCGPGGITGPSDLLSHASPIAAKPAYSRVPRSRARCTSLESCCPNPERFDRAQVSGLGRGASGNRQTIPSAGNHPIADAYGW